MATVVEVFDDKDSRDARLKELREKGHRPSKTSTVVPVKWKDVYELRYAPESRTRKRIAA